MGDLNNVLVWRRRRAAQAATLLPYEPPKPPITAHVTEKLQWAALMRPGLIAIIEFILNKALYGSKFLR